MACSIPRTHRSESLFLQFCFSSARMGVFPAVQLLATLLTLCAFPYLAEGETSAIILLPLIAIRFSLEGPVLELNNLKC